MDKRGDPNTRKVAIAKLKEWGVKLPSAPRAPRKPREPKKPARQCKSKAYCDWSNWRQTAKGNIAISIKTRSGFRTIVLFFYKDRSKGCGWWIINRMTGETLFCPKGRTFASAEEAADDAWVMREWI
jgi:hypothetical protein